jgi:hypothetical protein
LQEGEEADIFDGRVIIDRFMQTLTITGLDDIRVYEIYEEDGKSAAR